MLTMLTNATRTSYPVAGITKQQCACSMSRVRCCSGVIHESPARHGCTGARLTAIHSPSISNGASSQRRCGIGGNFENQL